MLDVTGRFMQVLPRHHSAGGSGTIRVKISKSIVVFTIVAPSETEVGTDCSMKFYPCLHLPFSYSFSSPTFPATSSLLRISSPQHWAGSAFPSPSHFYASLRLLVKVSE
jgi:hypothetical protein